MLCLYGKTDTISCVYKYSCQNEFCKSKIKKMPIFNDVQQMKRRVENKCVMLKKIPGGTGEILCSAQRAEIFRFCGWVCSFLLWSSSCVSALAVVWLPVEVSFFSSVHSEPEHWAVCWCFDVHCLLLSQQQPVRTRSNAPTTKADVKCFILFSPLFFVFRSAFCLLHFQYKVLKDVIQTEIAEK